MQKVLTGSVAVTEHKVDKQTVWLDEEAYIASFHPVEGYVEKHFRTYDEFMTYLHALQRCGFRFQ